MDLVLNLDAEKQVLTLGGALALRRECEILAKENNIDSTLVKFSSHLSKSYKLKVWEAVFESSQLKFIEIFKPIIGDLNWPLVKDLSLPLHSLSRLSRLCQQLKAEPFLKWKDDILPRALSKLQPNVKYICLHLKNVPPYKTEESNVDFEVWEEFLTIINKRHPGIHFLVVGDDKVSSSIKKLPNITCAKEENITLTEQLCFVGESSGFIGLASGICTAANLSKTPYVVVKNPNHHIEEMRTEIGKNDFLSFALDSQFLWRKSQTIEVLDNALEVIIKSNEFKK